MVPGNPAEGVEVLLSVWSDGTVLALHGHVDMGQGIRTALTQVVAEELDLRMDQVDMVLGDTARAPNQGPTIASASLQIHAVPLRHAAAQARAWLLREAAAHWGCAPEQLVVSEGVIHRQGVDPTTDAPCMTYGELLVARHVALSLDLQSVPKSASDYRVVGTSQPRVDIPAKAFGDVVFVHDMRVPGMLHGRVVRPPMRGQTMAFHWQHLGVGGCNSVHSHISRVFGRS